MAGYIGLPAEKANTVAGIINFIRNIGSAAYNPVRSVSSEPSQALGLQLVHSGASVADAPKLANGMLYRFVRGQAETLAYIDVFYSAGHRGEHNVPVFLHLFARTIRRVTAVWLLVSEAI